MNCIRLSFEHCASPTSGVRVMDIQTLHRFAGYNIGSCETNHLVLKDQSVCLYHAKIDMISTNEFVLTHLPTGRRDSVRVNDKWLPVGQSMRIYNLDRMVIGGVVVTFETNINI